MKPSPAALIAWLEAVNDPDLDDAQWIEQIGRPAQRLWFPEGWVQAARYDLDDGGSVVMEQIVSLDTPRGVVHCMEEMLEGTPRHVAMMLGSVKWGLSRERAAPQHRHVFERLERDIACSDVLGINTARPQGMGVGVFFGVPKGATLTSERRTLAERMARHLANALQNRLYQGDPEPVPSKRLSARQADVLHELLRGLTEKEMASRLGLSPHTIHQYVQELQTAYNVTSRPRLMALFLRRLRR